jgi:glycerophosphoryl diester phosphodiesterase
MTTVPLIQLLEEPGMRPYDFVVSGDPRTYADLCAPSELAAMAAYASGIGPWKRLIVGENPDKSLKTPSSLTSDAHAAGLLVHPYTFRNEARFLAPDYKNDPEAEYMQFFALGVDGLFSDFSDTAHAAREKFLKK